MISSLTFSSSVAQLNLALNIRGFVVNVTKNYIIACIYHPPKPRYNTEDFVRKLSADLENMLCTSGEWRFHSYYDS